MRLGLLWDILAGFWDWAKGRKWFAKTRVLLVEDDPHDAELALNALRKGRIACDWVESAEAAEEAINRGSYRLIFIDIKLGAMDGFELAGRLLVSSPDLRIWILTHSDIIIRGAREEFHVEPGTAIGFIKKSIRWEALVDAVRKSGLYL